MSIPVTLNNVSDLTNTVTAQNTINTNNNTITTAFSSALNTAGDSMDGTLDMNSNAIINLPAPVSGQSPVRLVDITTSTQVSVALPSMTGVVTAAATAGTSVTTFSGSGNLPVSQLAGGASATNTTFFRGDNTWANPQSASITAGPNISVLGSPSVISIATGGGGVYTYIQGAGATGAAILIGGTSDVSVILEAPVAIKANQTATSQISLLPGTTARVFLGVQGGTVGGQINFASSTGTGLVTISPAATSTVYNLTLPATAPPSAGSLFIASAGGNPCSWLGAATTTNQMFLSAATSTPSWSSAVWPVDVTTTNQILVCNASHTWSASQTVTNLTLTTPTLTTATMTGTTLMANATMSGSLTFSTTAFGVVGAVDGGGVFGATGCLGEIISTSVAQGAAIALVNGVASTLTSVTLSPGDWDGKASFFFQNNSAGSQITQISGCISGTATAIVVGVQGYANWLFPATSTFASTGVLSLGAYQRYNISTATTININMSANFTAGAVSAWCQTQFRRVR